MRRTLITLITFSLLAVGCSSSKKKELIDLDRVLDVFLATMQAQDANAPPADAAEAEAAAAVPTKVVKDENTIVLEPVNEDKPIGDTFIIAFGDALNQANPKIWSKPIGVEFNKADGKVRGFEDKNQNGVNDAAEKNLFSIEVDSAQNRLVATDLQWLHRRDANYRPRMGGLFAGYFLGRMLCGHRSAGLTANRFANTRMQPRGYHKGAAAKLNARGRSGSRGSRSSARSRGGSRSFFGGK